VVVQGVAVPLLELPEDRSPRSVFCVELPQGRDHGLMYGGNGRKRPPG